MSNFHTLPDILRSMAAVASDPATAATLWPLARGEFASAALVLSRKPARRLHCQPDHEELLIVLEGEADFQVADEVRRICQGDFVFVPRNATHGTIATKTEPFSFLSIIAPQFDLAKDVVWEGDAEPPRFRQV